MGWKGTLRSMNAASKRASRESDKKQRQANNAIDKINRTLDKQASEIERDLKKVTAAEQRITKSPIKYGEVTYSEGKRKWTLKTLSDETGDLTWSITPSFTSDDIEISGSSIQNGKKLIEVIDCAITQYGIIIACRVRTLETGKAAKKIHYAQNPDNSNIALLIDGESIRPKEANIDKKILNPNGEIAYIAFPTPNSHAQSFQLIWAHVEPHQTTQITLLNQVTIYSAAENTLISDQVREQFNKEYDKNRVAAEEVKEEIRKSASGCMVFFVILIPAILLAMSRLS